jgi:hypothetical protein
MMLNNKAEKAKRHTKGKNLQVLLIQNPAARLLKEVFRSTPDSDPELYLLKGRRANNLASTLYIGKYGVSSPKFFWAPCAQLYSLDETPLPPPSPPPPI